MIIAIDGPASSGKGKMVELLSKELDFDTLDTGAIYRVITIYLLENNYDYKDESEANLLILDKLLKSINIEVKSENSDGIKIYKYYLNNRDVTKEIRSKQTTEHVSFVSSSVPIRLFATEFTRKYAGNKDIIMDGRDIGTYVFPNAEIKIFLTADLEERAKRRFEQNKEKLQNSMTFEEVLENLKTRDYNDMYNKEIGALKQAEDAILVDNTNQSEDDTLQELLNIIKSKI